MTNGYRNNLLKIRTGFQIAKREFFPEWFDVVSIETGAPPYIKRYDKDYGFDWLAKCTEPGFESGIMGIAARMQPCEYSYGTFTIRVEFDNRSNTEYQKRSSAVRRRELYPEFTLQGYYHECTDKLLECNILRTKDLYDFIDEVGGVGAFKCINNGDGSKFMIINNHSIDHLFLDVDDLKPIMSVPSDLCRYFESQRLFINRPGQNDETEIY